MIKFRTNKPFNEIPNLPPQSDLESKNILRKCITARTALAELKHVSNTLPNQSILIKTMPLMEAQSSSEIENIVTTTDELFKYRDNNTSTNPAIKETLQYQKALMLGYESLQKYPLSTRTAEEICSAIKNTEMTVRKTPGTALKNSYTNKIIYTPPEGETLLRDKLSNLENFFHNESSLDPLIIMAVSHYQFEAIHPFTDGNGRTGRILNILQLVDKGLLNAPILYLSQYIIRNKQNYYKLLQNITLHNEWESWILFMLDAVEQTSKWIVDKIYTIQKLRLEIQEYIKKYIPEIYSYELSEVLFIQPYCRIQNLIDKNIAKRQTASTYLKKLTDAQVLTEENVGKEKLFINKRFLSLLTSENNYYDPLIDPTLAS